MLEPFEVAGVIYDGRQLLKHREELIQLRDGALEADAMEWAVCLSHTIAILAHMIKLFPVTTDTPLLNETSSVS